MIDRLTGWTSAVRAVHCRQLCAVVIAVIAMTLGTGAGIAAATPDVPGSAPNVGLSLSPDSGPPGTQVTAGGPLAQACARRATTVRWDRTAIASSLTFAIPARADVGQHTVSITCQVDKAPIGGQAVFTVTGPADVTSEPPTTRIPAPTDPYPVPAPPGPPVPPPGPAAIGVSTVGFVLLGLGLVGLVVLLQHLARARPDRSGRAGSGVNVIPVAGPASGPTLRSGRAGPGVDVRVVPRADRGNRAMRDR